MGTLLVSGQDVNLNQVEAGIAWYYKKYQKEQNQEGRERYSAAEIDARNAKRGLWREPQPVPPWEWRRIQRDK